MMWLALRSMVAAVALMLLHAEADAQDFGPIFGCTPGLFIIPPGCGAIGPGPGPTELPSLPTDWVALGRTNQFGALETGMYVPLSAFASAQALARTNAALLGLQGELARTNANVAVLQDQMSQVQGQVSQMQRQMAAFQRQSARLNAVAAAFTILPPNPGDRFSLTLGTAGWEGAVAASASGTYRLTDNTLLFAGYSRAATQSMAKGGMSLSFR